MAPTVSIALPVYNGARYIESAVRSLLRQKEELEIVISDDASSDNTINIVRSIGASNVKLIQNGKNGGQFVNFNRAIRACSGQFVQLFSHDDVARSGFIETQLEAFDRNEDAGLVYASCNIVDQNGRHLGVCDDAGTPLDVDFATYLCISSRHGSLPPSVSTVMVRRQVFDKVGVFDERFFVAGDLEFYKSRSKKL